MAEIIRNYQPQDKNKVFDIICRNTGKIVTLDLEKFFDWIQQISSANKTGNSSLVVVSEENITGYLSVIPCVFKIGSKKIEAGFVFDVYSDPEKRGVGIKLLRKIVYSDYLHFGAPGERVEELWSKLAKKETDNIVIGKLIKVTGFVDPFYMLKNMGAPVFLAHSISYVYKFVLNSVIKVQNHMADSRVTLSKENDFPLEVTSLFNEFSEDFYGIALKDHYFLSWRFCASPYDYQKIFVRLNQKLVGYLIYRKGTVNSQNVIVILETIAIGDKLKLYNLMLNQVISDALKINISYIQTNYTGCVYFWKALKSKGFFKRKNASSIVTNYHYYKDINRQHPKQNWFFSVADSDFEFANFKLETAT